MLVYKLINLEQGSSAWWEFRKTHITASEASVILGLNKYDNKIHLWNIKKGIAEPKEMNASMQRGKDLENVARNTFNKRYKPAVVESINCPWLSASLDGLYRHRLVEIKIPRKDIDISRNATNDWAVFVHTGKVPLMYWVDANTNVLHRC